MQYTTCTLYSSTVNVASSCSELVTINEPTAAGNAQCHAPPPPPSPPHFLPLHVGNPSASLLLCTHNKFPKLWLPTSIHCCWYTDSYIILHCYVGHGGGWGGVKHTFVAAGNRKGWASYITTRKPGDDHIRVPRCLGFLLYTHMALPYHLNLCTICMCVVHVHVCWCTCTRTHDSGSCVRLALWVWFSKRSIENHAHRANAILE